MEKEIVRLFQCHYHCPTVLLGLSETTSRVANQLIQMSDNEPYGVKGARVILKFKTSNGEEQSIGSFSLDPDTVSDDQKIVFLRSITPFVLFCEWKSLTEYLVEVNEFLFRIHCDFMMD